METEEQDGSVRRQIFSPVLLSPEVQEEARSQGIVSGLWAEKSREIHSFTEIPEGINLVNTWMLAVKLIPSF